MAFDTIVLSAMVRELSDTLAGGRIDKIQQPARDELILAVRSRTGNHRLLINAGANGPRIQLTRTARENPPAPPMFCMLLRKHLTGARLAAIRQVDEDRIVQLELECTDEMGEPCRRLLTAELMGRYSNIILIDAEGRITDCLRRVDAEMSPARQVLPGLFYRTPPRQEKLLLADADSAAVRALLDAAPSEVAVDKYLRDHFAFVSPLVSRELAFSAGGDTGVSFGALLPSGMDILCAAMEKLRRDMLSGSLEAWMLVARSEDEAGRVTEKPADFSFIPIRQYGKTRTLQRFENFSGMMDAFYSQREAAERMGQRAQAVVKTVKSRREKLSRKLSTQRQELLGAVQRDVYRHHADLLMANLHCIERGAQEVTVADFYEEDAPPVKIKLDPRRSPQQNAQQYYKQYARAKNAEHMLRSMIDEGERELEYLDSVLDTLSRAGSTAEIAEIRAELAQNGYASQKWAEGGASGRKKKPDAVPEPHIYRSSAGFLIYAGRNNRQNDRMTLKEASKNDIWLHTQKIPGSHVIIACGGKTPDERTLEEAALIAATHSSARESVNVPVDYTQVRYVRRQPNAHPGMVNYINQKTLIVTPDPVRMERMAVTEGHSSH